MVRHLVMLGLIISASACSQSPSDARVVNQSGKSIIFNYSTASTGRQKVQIAPGKVGYLKGVRRIADVSAMTITGPERSYFFMNWSQRPSNKCDGNCVITWKNNGTVSFTT